MFQWLNLKRKAVGGETLPDGLPIVSAEKFRHMQELRLRTNKGRAKPASKRFTFTLTLPGT